MYTSFFITLEESSAVDTYRESLRYQSGQNGTFAITCGASSKGVKRYESTPTGSGDRDQKAAS